MAAIDAPASITAVPGDLLEVGKVQTMADLSEEVPNLSVGSQFGINRAFIRGIGLTSIDLGGDGAVAFLVDGAQIPRPSEQLSTFYDLDRIEVLRGPQGTLYGRGATAGVLNLITSKPADHVSGYADLSFGNYDLKTFEGAVGGPLSDNIDARIAARLDKHDGYGTNLYTHTPIDDRNAQSFRGSIRIRPADHWIIDASVDYLHENDDNYAFHYLGPTTSTNAGLPAEQYFGGKTIFDCCGTAATPRDIWSSVDPTNKRHGIGSTVTVDWSRDDSEFKSVTAFRTFERLNSADLAVSNAVLYGRDDYDESSNSWTEDLSLSLRALDVEWLMGLNFFHERLFGSVKVPTTGLEVTLTAGQCTPRVPSASVACDAQDSGNYWQLGTVTTNAYGLFLQGTKSLSDSLSLTLGARFSHEERSGIGSFVFDAFGLDVATDQSASWNAVTPKALLEYRLDADALLYASINRGFKSGVINVGSTNPVVDPEYVYAYETGYKLNALNSRLQLATAAFYYDYKNLQIGFVNSQSLVETVNAAAARNYGIEAQLVPQLTEHFSLALAATYLNAKYTAFSNGYYRLNFAPVNLAGNYLDNAPPYTAQLTLTYALSLGHSGDLKLNLVDFYQGRVYFTEFNNSDATQGGYGLINANVEWQSPHTHWHVTGWTRNAADKFALSNTIIASYTYNNVRIGSLVPPRTYGVTLGYRF